MSDIVIRAESLGKRYLIGHRSAENERYTTMRDAIGRAAKGFMRSAGDLVRGRQLVGGDEVEEFWALQDVSFEIKRGEVVGIIGRNGAGKSTLLKILSRITEPSAGRVEIKGRVASLLEVGTGFHPELSGRENIYLNGAILGMTRAEIKRKFDEIVDFAGVEKFLDTPVKRYSSGMYVRLAFAVAAHLEPEILVVDEVLAVGDAEFQKKCLGKMKDVAGQGRTVLFVSHNMATIEKLCRRGILLECGSVRLDAEANEAVSIYASGTPRLEEVQLRDLQPRKGNGAVLFNRVYFTEPLSTARTASIVIELSRPIASSGSRCSLLFSDSHQRPIAIFSTEFMRSKVDLTGSTKLVCSVPRFPLAAGPYLLSFFLEVGGSVSDWIEHAVVVEVSDGDFFGSGKNLPSGWRKQLALIDHHWTCEGHRESLSGVAESELASE